MPLSLGVLKHNDQIYAKSNDTLNSESKLTWGTAESPFQHLLSLTRDRNRTPLAGHEYLITFLIITGLIDHPSSFFLTGFKSLLHIRSLRPHEL
jgi:hypothetical protein